MPLSEAWELVVSRESEWDDYDRAEVMAYAHAEARTCRNCGQPDAVVPMPEGDRFVTWGDGRRFLVKAYRCLSCGARDVVERDFRKQHEHDKPTTGAATPGDGRIHIAVEQT